MKWYRTFANGSQSSKTPLTSVEFAKTQHKLKIKGIHELGHKTQYETCKACFYWKINKNKYISCKLYQKIWKKADIDDIIAICGPKHDKQDTNYLY